MLNEKKSILIERENNLLVRCEGVVKFDEHSYETVSYEVWSDRGKFEADIHQEWKDGEQYIYCSNYATTDEEDMIKTFNLLFPVK